MRELGQNQKDVLECLRRNGPWCDSWICRWSWSTPSETTKIMDSLVKRGLVEVKNDVYIIKEK